MITGLARARLAIVLSALTFGMAFFQLTQITRPCYQNKFVLMGEDAAQYARGIENGHFTKDSRKHPAYAPAAAIIGKVGARIGFAWDPASFVNAVLASLAFGALWALAYLYSQSLLVGFAAGAAFFSSYAALYIATVPETYIFSGILIIATLMYARWFQRQEISFLQVISAALAIAICGWASPPNMAVGLIFFCLLIQRRAFSWALVLPLLTLIIWLVPMLLMVGSKEYLAWSQGYAQSWASFDNFTLSQIADNFIAYHVEGRTPVALDSATSHALLLAALTLSVLPLVGAVASKPGRYDPVVQSLLGAALVTFVFYIYFNPMEALLYVTAYFLFVEAAFAAAAKHLPSGTVRAIAITRIAIALVLVFVNVQAIQAFGATCVNVFGAR